MASMDLYMSMGFSREWALRAPQNPDVGIPWLLRATTINTMPKRFQREGEFEYTFYKSIVQFVDMEYIVDDYDPLIKILRITSNLSTMWVSLADPNLRFIEECHHIKTEKRALTATEHIPLPVIELSTNAMPQDIRMHLCERGVLRQEDLSGDWNFHTAAEDGNIWLGLLRLTNKNDPSIRFTPSYPRPRSITSQCITRYRNEMKTKIGLFCMCVPVACFTVQNILQTENDDFETMMAEAGEYEAIFRDLRHRYWNAREIIRQELLDWKNACISPMHLEKIVYVNGRARVHLALTEWSFTPLQTDMQKTVVPFYFSIIFNKMFNLTLHEPDNTCDTYPDTLFEEQKAVYGWMVKTEERNRHIGWWSRQEEDGFVWSYSVWGECVRGLPPEHSGGILYTRPGSGKTVLIAALCDQRNLPTLIIVPKRTRIKYWAKQFQKFAPRVRVLKLERSTTQWDDQAGVVISTWTTYRNHYMHNGLSWARLVVDSAHKTKTQRERLDFLKSLRCKHTWLLTNVPNIVPAYRELLRVPTNRLDVYITAPECNIEDRLSTVKYYSHELEITDAHRRLRLLFYDNCTNRPKVINKWSRTIETQPQHIPKQYYATEQFPSDWSPISRNAITSKRVREQIKETCSICYEDPEIYVITQCNHVFCKKCIQRHLEVQNNCPICRTTINTCNFILSPQQQEEYLYINKTRAWVRLNTDITHVLNTYKDDTSTLEDIIEEMEGLCVFVSEYPIRLKNSTMYVDEWDAKTCLRMTYKQAFKKEYDISRADNLICLGSINEQEMNTLGRQLQRINSNHVSTVHVCFY